MVSHKVITINGRRYNAVTGLAMQEPVAAGAVHTPTQRSTTLNRHVAQAKKKPAPQLSHKVTPRPKTGQHMDIARNPPVTRHAAVPRVASVKPSARPVRAAAAAGNTASAHLSIKGAAVDHPAQLHPVAARALAKQTQQRAAQQPQKAAAPRQIKEAAIAEALAKPQAPTPKNTAKTKKQRRIITSILAVAVLVLGGLYVVFQFVPSVSVAVAAAHAGVKASYPDYIPDGYALSQPITYSDGQVSLRFTSNSNSQDYYTVVQKKSTFDSTSVLDNIVRPKVGDNYATTKERGLTIFTYSTNAIWANGGVLYSVEGNASLSSDQIRRIATSL